LYQRIIWIIICTCADVAKRLLSLLGMDEDDDEDLLSSSEDEGVEVDIDELEDDDEGMENPKLLHQLASLVQELKYSQKQSSASSSKETHQARSSMDMVQDTSYLGHVGCLQDRVDYPVKAPIQGSDVDFVDELDERGAGFTKFTNFGSSFHRDRRLWPEGSEPTQAGRSFGNQQDSWTVGWDSCASEAIRYLVEDEGLPLHHPAVIAMKNHLDLQRERAYVGYAEAKSQDMSLILD